MLKTSFGVEDLSLALGLLRGYPHPDGQTGVPESRLAIMEVTSQKLGGKSRFENKAIFSVTSIWDFFKWCYICKYEKDF